jgi:hypothetical protein
VIGTKRILVRPVASAVALYDAQNRVLNRLRPTGQNRATPATGARE